MPELAYLVRRALSLPPHVAAYRAGRLTIRTARAYYRRARDRLTSSYGPVQAGTRLARRVRLDAIPATRESAAALAVLAEHAIAHRFDLLGSGWVRVAPGMSCAGLEGIRHPPAEARPPGRAPPVTRANASASARVWALVDDPGYAPIDWQIDFRSGYRWRELVAFGVGDIGPAPGADVKLPWELSRMQHLPRLALAARLAGEGAPGFGPPERYRREIRNQILDFIASNPPRFGAAWGCPMDIGIRAANWCLALDIASGGGQPFDAAFEACLAASLRDHGRHIVANLEWSESGRSNHYLADLAGLAFIGAYLPAGPQSDAWLAFAATEIAAEVLGQFGEDGGSYEGSVAYHRLSAELVVYPVALLLGLDATRSEGLARAERAALGTIRVPVSEDFGGAASALARELPAALAGRLDAMARFALCTARPDGRLVQIGDTDSGRLFKLDPVLESDGREDELRALPVARAIEALFGPPRGETEGALGAAVVASMRGPLPRSRIEAAGPSAPSGRDRDDDETIPTDARRYRIALPAGYRAALRHARFPCFGLYVWSSNDVYIALRCAEHGRADAPMGHTHDDNLALEVWASGVPVVEDPGTYVYTGFPELRRAYRGPQAHFAPRAVEWDAVSWPETYLFDARHDAVARCLRADADGAQAVLEHPRGSVGRRVELTDAALVVTDWASGCTLGPPAAQSPPPGRGYGRHTGRAQVYPAPLASGT